MCCAGSGPCDGLITRLGILLGVCLIVCDLEISTRQPRPDLGYRASLLIRENIKGVALLNLLTPNDDYSGRTAPLTSKRCILYIYSTHIGTEYFKHGIYSPFFPLQNAVCFIILTYLVPGLFTFYIQGVLKLKK